MYPCPVLVLFKTQTYIVCEPADVVDGREPSGRKEEDDHAKIPALSEGFANSRY